jgi:hypothetical protein
VDQYDWNAGAARIEDEGVVVSEVDDGFFARRDVNLAGRFYPGVAATHRVNGTGTSNERSSVVDDA